MPLPTNRLPIEADFDLVVNLDAQSDIAAPGEYSDREFLRRIHAGEEMILAPDRTIAFVQNGVLTPISIHFGNTTAARLAVFDHLNSELGEIQTQLAIGDESVTKRLTLAINTYNDAEALPKPEAWSGSITAGSCRVLTELGYLPKFPVMPILPID